MKFKKLILISMSLGLCAASVKIKQVGQADVYVPTMDNDNSTNLTINKLKANKITDSTGVAAPPGMVPVGGMIAVMPTTHANAWQPPADCSTVKNGFMRTNTSVGVACVVPSCSDCVIPTGTTLPNMYQKHTRGGGASSGGTGGSNTTTLTTTQLPAHTHTSTSLTVTGSPALSGNVSGGTCSGTFGSSSHIHGHGSIYAMAEFTGGSIIATRTNVSFTGQVKAPLSFSASSDTTSFATATGGSTGGPSETSDVSSTAASNGTLGVNAGTLDVGGSTDSSGTGSAYNSEPSYVEVIWIIRVK